MFRKIARMLIVVGLMALAVPAAQPVSATGDLCGQPETYTLWALWNTGQPFSIGTVTVSNDSNNLYVTFQTTGNWYMYQTGLFMLGSDPGARLNLNTAPYQWAADLQALNLSQSVTLVAPLNVACDMTLWLQAIAKMVRVENGLVKEWQYAHGGTIAGTAHWNWYGNIVYTVQCCEEEPTPPCYEVRGHETAWADGERYNPRGNWATYTPYVPDSTVVLYAGQTMNAGTVHFSAPENGNVIITINLADEWGFGLMQENVKIQDYEQAPPSRNPQPGRFAWKANASGQSFSITVPLNNFYGVHVDVGYRVEIPCPAQ